MIPRENRNLIFCQDLLVGLPAVILQQTMLQIQNQAAPAASFFNLFQSSN